MSLALWEVLEVHPWSLGTHGQVGKGERSLGACSVGCRVIIGLPLDPHRHFQTITHPSSWKTLFSQVSLIWPIKPTRFRGAASMWRGLEGWAVIPAEKDEGEANEGHLRQSKERSNMFSEF